ncbi:hypothetical protein BT96DRAFT_818219, partial [Gymnopus androsaceus JB14]
NGTFTKYIHNGSPFPLLDGFEKDYDICLFLCACQHLQYSKTQELPYVSDYQGYGNLLTDAQIMTSPIGKGVFGDGNIETCFNSFPLEHECNDFCAWMELQCFGRAGSEPNEEA